ncbi:MAG: ligand-binding SRPBCC domain-containing protein [Psychromonas sp.]|jgi:ligand-binding SRPBCC domain-containing protein
MINFKSHSGIYTLESSQEIPIPLDQAWDFFSSPKNLQAITPPKMGFIITSDIAARTYAGQIISYTVSILPGIRANWVTEITTVKEQDYFVDEQRYGPYSMWHHEHFFEATPEGNTIIRDKISYKIPLGFIGRIMNGLFIESQLKDIFNYRTEKLKEVFQS